MSKTALLRIRKKKGCGTEIWKLTEVNNIDGVMEINENSSPLLGWVFEEKTQCYGYKKTSIGACISSEESKGQKESKNQIEAQEQEG